MVAAPDSAPTVLVTGGAGFIGSHVVQAYQEAGWPVVALDDLSSGRKANVPEGVELIKGQARTLAYLRWNLGTSWVP